MNNMKINTRRVSNGNIIKLSYSICIRSNAVCFYICYVVGYGQTQVKKEKGEQIMGFDLYGANPIKNTKIPIEVTQYQDEEGFCNWNKMSDENKE